MTLRRLVGVLVSALAMTMFVGPGTASAHTTMQFTIVGDGGTGVLAYASWTDDNQPVTEPVRGSVEAYADGGRHVGPVELRRAPRGGSYYTARLPEGTTGSWRVLVQATYPGPGASERLLVLGSHPTGFPATVPIPVPTPPGAGAGDAGLFTAALAVTAVAATVIASVLLVARRRLARPDG